MLQTDTLFKITAALVLFVFALISFHAPLSVYFGTFFPEHHLLIKSWKEIGIILAALIFLPLSIKRGLAQKMLKDTLFRLIAGFILLHFIALTMFHTSPEATFAGMLIDLRYSLFFTLVYAMIRYKPSFRPLIIKTTLCAAIGVVVFGFLQIVILPHDILSHIGYSKATIAPYLTVDRNPDYVRINSTLRGPNPLGHYVAIFLTVVLSHFVIKKLRYKNPYAYISIGSITLMSLAVLWSSYSRSALLVLIVALTAIVALNYSAMLKRYWLTVGAVAIVLCLGLFVVFRSGALIQQIAFHSDPLDSSAVNSNEQHVSSLTSAWHAFVTQPLGSGVGSTGSASLLGNSPAIIENQYLFVAHEVGWVGLGLFLAIFGVVLRKLFVMRKDYLSLGLLAAGLGLAVAGLVLPVFADDTVALMWWGLAAVALAAHKTKKVQL